MRFPYIIARKGVCIFSTSYFKISNSNNLQVLQLADVCKLTQLSKPTIYKQIKAGQFPKQIQLSPHRVGWFQHEIVSWLQNLGAQRNVGLPAT